MENEVMVQATATTEEEQDSGWEDLFDDAAENAEGEETEGMDEEPEVTEDEDENPEAEDPAEESQPEEEPQEEAQEERITFDFNGQAMDLTREETIQLAKAGLGSQALMSQLEEAKSHPSIALVQEMAEMSGLSVEDYTKQAMESMKQRYVEQMTGLGMEQAAAEQLWADRAELAALRREKLARENEAQQAAQNQEALRQQAADFVAAYPEVKEFPQAAADYIRQHPGTTMKEAYQATEIARLREELERAQAGRQAAVKAAQNKAAAPGSVAGAGNNAEDDFTASLLGD